MRIGGRSIVEVWALPIRDAVAVFEGLQLGAVESEIAEVQTRIDALQREAEDHLYAAYAFEEAERDLLRAAVA